MMYLGIHDWTMEFSPDCYCWMHSKTITINTKYKGKTEQIILHEIAHISTAKYSHQPHNPEFWKHLEFLTKKFLHKELDEYQQFHREYSTVGRYMKKLK